MENVNDAKARLLARVKALLSKTTDNGCTEAEALAAMEKARAIMDENGLTELDIETSKEEIKAEGFPLHSKFGAREGLACNIAKYCDCKVWRNKGLKNITFFGHLSDTTLAGYMLETLSDFVVREADSFATSTIILGPFDFRSDAEKKVDADDARRSFAMGCVARLNERLAELAKAREGAKKASDGRSLIVMKMAVVERAFGQIGVHLNKSRGRRRTVNDFGAFEAGKSAANKAHIGGAINGGAGVKQIAH